MCPPLACFIPWVFIHTQDEFQGAAMGCGVFGSLKRLLRAVKGPHTALRALIRPLRALQSHHRPYRGLKGPYKTLKGLIRALKGFTKPSQAL